MNANLLSRIVHELVVCTTEYSPEARKGRMWDDEVTCRVTISVSYLGVVDADPVSRRGLDVRMSAIHPKTTTWRCIEQHRTSTTNS